MKKFMLVLGMVTCLVGVSACGNANDIHEASLSIDEASQLANAYVDLVDGIISEGINVDENAEVIEQYYGIPADVMKAAAENYSIALEDLGTYQSVSDVSFVESEKEVVVNATVTGSKSQPDGAPRTAEVIITLELPKGTLKSMLTNVNYTFGEKMTTAGLNTLLGLFTVFLVLCILMALIYCFIFISKAEKAAADRKAGKSAANASVDNAVAQITKNEETQDDTELIAVIAAAIAASEGAASSDGYVVRSIRRRF